MKRGTDISNRVTRAATQTRNAFFQAAPILAGVILLVAIAIAGIPQEWYQRLFTGSILDPVIGAALGSIAAGNPLTSYIIGGELLKSGVSLVAVTAFILSWVTVGIVQLPAEITLLGKRFAYTRNITSFLFAILIAILTTIILQVIL